MLRFHTIPKDNIIKEAVNNNWTNYDVDIIKKITNVWLDSNIAESVLLFFIENVNGDLHSYMPIVSKYKKNVPPVINYKREKVEAEIIGVDPFIISSDSIQDDDDTTITGIMKKYYWYGNEVFNLTQINKGPFTRESIATAGIPVIRGQYGLRENQTLGNLTQREQEKRRKRRERIRMRRKLMLENLTQRTRKLINQTLRNLMRKKSKKKSEIAAKRKTTLE